MSSGDFSQREFPMTDENFEVIRKVAYEFTGITLSDHKKEMIYSRLSRRIRRLGFRNFDQYCLLLEQPDHHEHNDFINAITTNLTSFFREPHHFDYLKETVFPELLRKNQGSRRVRIWSAGCSTGEEPYSIAMVLKEAGFGPGWDVKILATDLDSNVLQTAKNGVYSLERVEGISEERRKRWFLRDKDSASGLVRVKPSVRELITFNRLNLMDRWPMKGPFDLIFCRNVVIYFNKDTQRVLFDRYANILANNAYLFIGHSESLNNVTNRFTGVGKTIYRKIR